MLCSLVRRARARTIVAVALAGLLMAPEGRAEDPVGVVTVRGRAGRLLEGVAVRRRSGHEWIEVGRTASDGTFTLPSAAVSEGWDVLPSLQRFPDEGDLAPQRAVARRLDFTIDCGADVRIDVVDAVTGKPVAGARWRFGFGGWSRPSPTSWVASGEAAFLLVGRDGYGMQGLEIQGVDPQRYAVADVDVAELRRDWRYMDRAGAASLVGTVPLRRNARVEVAGQAEDGTDTPLTEAAWRYVLPRQAERGSASSAQPVPSLALYVPHFAGAQVEVRARGGKSGGRTVALPSVFPTAPIRVQVPLVEEEPADWTVPGVPKEPLIGIGGAPVTLGTGADPSGGLLRLTVESHDGRSLRGAVVSVTAHGRRVFLRGITSSDGTAMIEHLAPGVYAVDVWHPEALRIRRTVEIRSTAEPTVLRLTEPFGGQVEVTVVGVDGTPLPFAGVTLLGAGGSGGELAPGPTRLDPFTDHRGRRTFRRIDAGEAKIRAWCGPFGGSTSVKVVDADSVSVQVVLRQGES